MGPGRLLSIDHRELATMAQKRWKAPREDSGTTAPAKRSPAGRNGSGKTPAKKSPVKKTDPLKLDNDVVIDLDMHAVRVCEILQNDGSVYDLLVIEAVLKKETG
jgi:hypothetical protein